MKRSLLAGLGALVLGFAVPASAADLPRRGPAVAPVAVAPIYNWTGFYIGGHVGWGRGESDFHLDPAFGFGSGSILTLEGDGFLGGGQVGFNYQVGTFVFGVEGQFSWTDISHSISATDFGITASLTTESNWIATIAGRLGVAFGNALFYGKGGVAFLDWTTTACVTGFGCASAGDTETGWMVGVGLEYGFTPNWSAKIEYNFNQFDDVARNIFAGTGLENDVEFHVVKFGINYRFGPFVAPPPVAARY
jgi:outer membrane immunogenic protein